MTTDGANDSDHLGPANQPPDQAYRAEIQPSDAHLREIGETV